MHMQKHVFATYSTTPGPVTPREPLPRVPPARSIVDTYAGEATIAAYSVIHGRDGVAESGVAICDLPDGARCYARFENDLLEAEKQEFGGRKVNISPQGDVNHIDN
jgi:acetyl-CoA C-acetyltransferase